MKSVFDLLCVIPDISRHVKVWIFIRDQYQLINHAMNVFSLIFHLEHVKDNILNFPYSIKYGELSTATYTLRRAQEMMEASQDWLL